jgi:hypothetical protein
MSLQMPLETYEQRAQLEIVPPPSISAEQGWSRKALHQLKDMDWWRLRLLAA